MSKFFVYLFSVSVLLFSFACQCGPGEQSQKASSDVDFDVDMGGKPWAFDIEAATLANEDYRSVNWTGEKLQLVFMTLKPGDVIDLELHGGHDQFIRIEEGKALVEMGKEADNLTFRQEVKDDWAIMIPAGYWHRVENTGNVDLKLYTLYGPAEHEYATSHKTYEEAKAAHHHHHDDDHTNH